MALDAGYAVSLVLVNSQEGGRFNRLDTIVGSICREIEIIIPGRKGLVGCLTLSHKSQERSWQKKSARHAENFQSGTLVGSLGVSEITQPSMVALRAWVATHQSEIHDLVEDWLSTQKIIVDNEKCSTSGSFTTCAENLEPQERVAVLRG